MVWLFRVVVGAASIALLHGENASAQQRVARCDNPVPAYPVSAQTKLRDRAIRTLLADAAASFVRCVPLTGTYLRVMLDFRSDGSLKTTFYSASAAQGPWRLNPHVASPTGTDIGTWQIANDRLCVVGVFVSRNATCFNVFRHQGRYYWKSVGSNILANGEIRIEPR